MATSEKDRLEDWKDKYFKSLNEIDEKERKQSEQIARLSRDMLALLSPLRGHDAVFDREFDAVSNFRDIHDATEQKRLRALVDAGERLATELSAAGPSATKMPAPDPVPEVAKEPPFVSRMQQLADAIDVPEDSRKLLQNIRDRLGDAGDQIDNAEIVASVAAGLSQIFDANGMQNVQEARDSVQALIDHLSLPESAHAGLAKFTRKLQSANDLGSIRTFAKELADFLVKYVNSLQGEISGLNDFLVEIKAQLGMVFEHVATEDSERVEAAAARAELDTSVRGSLDDLRIHIDEAADMDQLKQDIQQQLAAIDGNVTAFIEVESKRVAKAENRTRTLTAAIKELADESEVLRGKLENARKRAVRDPLTELPNRLAYNERLRAEYACFQRSGGSLSVVVVDIDKFKLINDTYGHQAGDRVLKHLSRELNSQIRKQDFFGRFGGEEFVLILPDTDRNSAVRLADALRSHIESCRFKYRDEPVKVTISCGIAEFGTGESTDAAFERADAGLYAAKNNGRNRCEAL